MPHLDPALETIFNTEERSVNLMINPDLRDLYFWHSHPEIELVYIEATSGNRCVGEHISRFSNSDLVLIGPDIPHLNFDYGIRSDYEKRVIHLRKEFLEESTAGIAELGKIRNLLRESRHGIAFGDITRARLSDQIKSIRDNGEIELLLSIISILSELASATDKIWLHDQPIGTSTSLKDNERLKKLYTFIDSNYHRKITNEDAAEVCSLSYEAFCRYFKKKTRLTFTEFVNQYRIDKARKLLLRDSTVTNACFETGFESLSYFNRRFRQHTGMSPRQFKKQHLKY